MGSFHVRCLGHIVHLFSRLLCTDSARIMSLVHDAKIVPDILTIFSPGSRRQINEIICCDYSKRGKIQFSPICSARVTANADKYRITPSEIDRRRDFVRNVRKKMTGIRSDLTGASRDNCAFQSVRPSLCALEPPR